MPILHNPNVRILAVAFGLIIVCCLPIWSVDYYVNQDGFPHLYNAFLLNELLKGNEKIAEFVSINHALIPNLTGHWILAGLLKVFSPPTALKLFVSLLFAVSALSTFWLRLQVAGRQNSLTALLLSVALTFNWMWFLGFYNFILGVSGVAFTLGLWWRWRQNLNAIRAFIIFLLLIFVFFSHLISFTILGSLLGFLSLIQWKKDYFRKTFLGTFSALLLAAPLFINYLILSRSNAKAEPSWGYLQNPFSISDWFLHLRTADPFQLMSRKAIPFVEMTSSMFGMFSPTLYLFAAIIIVLACLFLSRKQIQSEEKTLIFVWSFISILLFLLWIFAPNDFGKTHGGLLRERILYIGLICFLPVFRIGENLILERIAQFCLVFVILFQTLVVFEYAQFADGLAKQLQPVKQVIEENQSFGSIIINRDGCKFKPIPRSNLTTFISIDRNNKVWDNYELGYYLFPVVAKNDADSQFIYDFRESNTFDYCDPQEQFDSKINNLKELMPIMQSRFDVLLVWGKDDRIEPMIGEFFEAVPFYQNGDVRLFKSRFETYR